MSQVQMQTGHSEVPHLTHTLASSQHVEIKTF